MLGWWSGVLEADVRFANDFIAFLSFDDEHHRVAMISVPNLMTLVMLVVYYLDSGEFESATVFVSRGPAHPREP